MQLVSSLVQYPHHAPSATQTCACACWRPYSVIQFLSSAHSSPAASSFYFHSFCKPSASLIIISPNVNTPVNKYFAQLPILQLLTLYFQYLQAHSLTNRPPLSLSQHTCCILLSCPTCPPATQTVLTGNHIVPFSPSLSIHLLLVVLFTSIPFANQHLSLFNPMSMLLSTLQCPMCPCGVHANCKTH